MVRQIAVGDIMTRNLAAVAPKATLLECAKKMVRERVGSVIVAQDRKLIGILTQKDILWAITKKPGIDLRKVHAIDFCAKRIAVIKPSAAITEAFEKMKHYGFRRLPVLSKGELIGVLTLKDILAIEPAFYSKSSDLFGLREAEDKIRKLSKHEIWETEGLCEECGALSDLLRVENKMLCRDCREDNY